MCAEVVEVVPKMLEVVLNVLGGCAEGGRGCAEVAYRLCRRWWRS